MEEENIVTVEETAANHLDILNGMADSSNDIKAETQIVDMLLSHNDVADKMEQDSEQFEAKMKLENRKLDIEERKLEQELRQHEETLAQQKADNKLKKWEIGLTFGAAVVTVGAKIWCKKKDVKMLDVVGHLEENGVWRTTASKIAIGRIGRE